MRLIDHALRLAGHSCAYVANTVAESLWPAPAVQRAHAAAEALADVEAEEEVAEPYCGPDIQPGDTAGQPNDGLRAVCDLLDSDAVWKANVLRDIADDLDPPQQTTPAGVDGSTPPPAGTDWLGWCEPAVLDVLAEHMPFEVPGRDDFCMCGAYIDDSAGWREHLAPILARRIACDPAKAIAALQSFQPK